MLRRIAQRWWLRLLAAGTALLTLIGGALIVIAAAVGGLLPKPDQIAYMAQNYFNQGRSALSWDIMVRDLNRNLSWALTRWPSNERYPAWSPDGRQIAFHSDRAGYWDIYLMDADGRNLRRLTDQNPAASLSDADSLDYSSQLRSQSQARIGFSTGIAMAAWSPDGQSIGFHADYNGTWDLLLVGLDGQLKQRLTNRTGDDVLMSWSPDGERIAYVSDANGTMEIYVMDIARPIPRQLTGSVGYTDPYGSRYGGGSWHPEWSPDGRQIVFASSRDGIDDIYIMDADGSNVRRLTDTLSGNQNPIWTRDGRHIVFSSDRRSSSRQYQVFMMDTEGGNVRQLTFGPPSDAPAWRP